VPLRKLRAFQDFGHQAVLIIGDFTATIGDPSGRSEQRKQLSKEEVEKNLKTYLAQAKKVLNLDKVEIYYNSEWFGKEGLMKLYELTSKVTIQRAMERDDFQKRLADNKDISTLEILYPLFQGYDSVKVKADVEIGGKDQKFNLLMGRRVQRGYNMKEQDIMTTWLIEGTDGSRKMSKSFGNYIGLMEAPESMHGKIMSIPDDLVIKYFQALTDVSGDEIRKMEKELKSGANPRDLKLRLAREIVAMYHSETAAKKAEKNFIKTFSLREMPEEIKKARVKNKNILDVLVETGLCPSKSDARRNVEQGGVSFDRLVIKDIKFEIKKSGVLKKGKRHFIKIIAP
jgi:tyrosyl-tRNA synthetase